MSQYVLENNAHSQRDSRSALERQRNYNQRPRPGGPGGIVKMLKNSAHTLMNNVMLGELLVYTKVTQMRLFQNADMRSRFTGNI